MSKIVNWKKNDGISVLRILVKRYEACDADCSCMLTDISKPLKISKGRAQEVLRALDMLGFITLDERNSPHLFPTLNLDNTSKKVA